MRALALVIRSELRYRWRSWLALSLLVSVVGGVTLGATAAGRRTASAFPRYDAQYGFDAFVYSFGSDPKVATLPEVRWSELAHAPATGTPVCGCRHPVPSQEFGVTIFPPRVRHPLFKLVSGRMPDPNAPSQALASFNFARDEGIHAGSLVRVPFFSPDQFQSVVNNVAGNPAGPTVVFRVVGIEAAVSDFPSVGNPSYSLVPSPGFIAAYGRRIADFDGYLVRLRHGSKDIARFDQDALASGAAGTTDVAQTKTSTEAAIHPQAEGWWVLALLAGLAGLAIVGQALSRQSSVEAEEYRTLAAVGMSSGDLMTLGLGRALVIGGAGALGSVLLAYLLSPIAPVGEARVAEPSAGLAFDPFVLGLGAIAVVAAVVLLALWPTYRASRLMRGAAGGIERPSPVVASLAATGAPPSTVIGVRRALDRGRGRESVPVGSALGGAVLAVAALCGTAVFGASLTHLVSTPKLYGQDFQLWFNGAQNLQDAAPVENQLRSDPAVDAVTLGLQTPVVIDGISTHSIAGTSVKGPLLISPASGRIPGRPGEVALGSKTMHQVHAHIGSMVRMTFPLESGGSRTVSARVVGTASFAPDFGVVGLGTGAYMSFDGLVDAQCGPAPGPAGCRDAATHNPVLLTGTVPGARGRAAVQRYAQQYAGFSYLPVKPDNLVNFGQAVNFPLILGAVLMMFGLATLFHVLVVSVARRRRELGLLKAVGLVRHQIVSAVCWQATTVAVVGLAVGMPLGIIAGRAVWNAFAVNIGVVPDSVIEVPALVALSAGVLVIANLLAIGPALVSARIPSSSLLKTE